MKTIDELRGKLDRRDKRLGQYKDHLRNKESEVRQLYGDIDRTRRKVDDLQTELDSTNGKLERLNHLLSQRTDELKMVDSYISRTNTHSDVELKKMVEMLNQEISQTSSTIIDSFDFGARVPIRIGRTQEKGILYGLGNGLPLKFLKYLSKHQTTSEDITEDLAVALAVQAVIAKCAFDFAWSWCPSNSELDNYLEDIYQGLCSTDPLTAPRWRAMTRSQIRKDESAEEVKFCRSCLDSRLELLLKVCGWTPDYIKQNQRHAEAIDHGLSVIVSKALNLNKALLEGTIQGGAKPLWFEGRSVFNPNHADDSFSRPVLGRSGEDTLSQPPACKVLCTTDLGLQITTTRSDQTVVATVLKAKIILEDTLFGNVVDDTGRA
ncbi:hypothetical protein AX16_004350 [Volvariella volvacea WC 439]|nr:hypothetical protein AX16_004350 [Volvariella volvacea WC 439]